MLKENHAVSKKSMHCLKALWLKQPVVILVLGLLFAFSITVSGQNKRLGSAIDSLIEQRMEEAGMVGLAAAIIVDKEIVWLKGYGFADKQRKDKFTPHTIMNIGSISKTVTGAALMQAVQAEKLSLDEDINTYLSFKVINPFFPEKCITLRQLATHTSGITDRWELYERSYYYGSDSPEELGAFLRSYLMPDGIEYSKENFLNAKPGTQRDYSNIAAGLAGYIVEQVVGEKLNVYTRKNIFAPLKMNNSYWFLSEVDLAKHSKLYVSQGGTMTPIPLYGVTTYPDGGVRTSVADLSKFFIALLNEGEYDGTRILEKPIADEMLRFQFTELNKPSNVNPKEKNSGIFWATKNNTAKIGHGGSDPGITTEMLSNRTKDTAVVIFTNTSFCSADRRVYVSLRKDLWEYAESLKTATH